MSWSTPLTAAANGTLTAGQWNASVRDNLNETETAKATTAGRLIVTTAANQVTEREIVTDFIGTSEGTASGGYTDLPTIGPDVTVTTGIKGLVFVGFYTGNNTAQGRGWMSHAIDGASFAIAYDRWAAVLTSAGVNNAYGGSQVTLWKTLTPGENHFTAKYRTSTVGTSTFAQRRLIVQAL